MFGAYVRNIVAKVVAFQFGKGFDQFVSIDAVELLQ
jgi:hypothetical protein